MEGTRAGVKLVPPGKKEICPRYERRRRRGTRTAAVAHGRMQTQMRSWWYRHRSV